ncbi:hypothetical protein U9M48_007445 [Paspalum notatum var. saurae]|uniref:Reverse transcriptase Ty1/copia-type domain-containing protein n=1 Tax=Paspalum notatum var. saurae TaxID=547442 RepID=A0AAQ3PRT1_PASNO
MAPPPPRHGLTAEAPAQVSPLPGDTRAALADANWRAAMTEEYKALVDNGTWRLVPRPPRANVITDKWVFKHKYHADGSLARHKARWVIRGFSQRYGIDYDETFSPVVKPATIRSSSASPLLAPGRFIESDVKNAFFTGTRTRRSTAAAAWFRRPHRSRPRLSPAEVLAPRAWYQRFSSFVQQSGFTTSISDTSLFVYKEGADMAYSLLYVDDIILTASSTRLLRHFTELLHSEFAMTDLGDLHHFLGISVARCSDGLFLSQRQYAADLLQRAGMAECHSTATPVDTRAKLRRSGVAGALQYLTLTRPDLAYAVQQVCLFMHDPREPHLAMLKRVLRYVKGTLSTGLHIGTGSITSLTAYSDADWAGCPDSRRSTSGYCLFLGDNLVSWSSKRQTTVSCSSAEAEYRAVAHAMAETCWLRQLLQELHAPISSATIVYCDNVSAVYMTANPVHHRRTKHIEIDIHFVREKVALGQVRVLHVPSSHQFADIMTKGLPVQLFTDFRTTP